MPAGGGGFIGLGAPMRLADTRASDLVPQVPAECWVRVGLPASVPADAKAVAVTVTSDRVAGAGFFTVHGCGTGLPEFSTLNVSSAGPNSNFAVIDVDATRQICVYTSIRTDIIVDLIGYFETGGSQFAEVDPARVLDTRAAGAPGRIPPPQIREGREVRLNRSQLGVPGDTEAVMVNLTVTRADRPGYLVAYPCGEAIPPTSNVNFAAGQDRANTSVVALGNGELCLRPGDADVDIIVDLVGRFTSSDGLDYRVGMARLVDSRNRSGPWSGKFTAGETRAVDVGAAVRLPGGSQVAVLGVVATRATAAGFLQVRQCASADDISSVNFDPGDNRAIANIVVVPLSDARTVCVTSSAPVDVVVDLYGAFGSDGVLRALEVTGPGGAQMFPAFRPGAPDYDLVCAQVSSNQLRVTARGAPGHELRIRGATDWSVRLDTTVVRTADQAVVIEARTPAGPAGEVWVRCLPPNFPQVNLWQANAARTPGWYLVNVDVAANNYAVILDQFGAPVWYRSGGAEGHRPRGLQRLGNGDLAWFPARGFAFGIDPDANFEQVTLEGALVRTYGIADARRFPDPPAAPDLIDATNHHELLALPNGNFMVISMPVRRVDPTDPAERFACSAADPVRPGQFTTQNATMVAGARIVELSPEGTPTGWEWDADVLGHNGFSTTERQRIAITENTLPLCFRTVTGEFIYGALHPNGLAWRPAAPGRNAQVLMSARHADAIYAIDYSTREVTWKLGGRQRAGVSLGVSGVAPTRPARQHDVQVLHNGDITMFDNRTAFAFETFGSTSGAARFIQYRIDDQRRSASIVRTQSRSNGDNSGALGSARLQPDGAVVLGWGAVPGPLFTEVDVDGVTMLELAFSVPEPSPVVISSYRVIKEPLDSFERDRLRRTAGGTRVELRARSLALDPAVLFDGDGEY